MPADSDASTAGLPAAVLWDLDGTLVDTEPSWMAAEHALAAEHGATWTHQDALSVVGKDLRDSGRIIVDRMRLPLTVDEVVQQLMASVVAALEAGVEVRPGVAPLLAELGAAGVPCAVVTMSYDAIARSVVRALGENLFAAVVTGDAVTHGKPHPEPYLTAADRLGVAPQDCFAIEDSPTGAASADAAGCQVIVVPNMVEVTPKPEWTLLDTLAGVSVRDLVRQVEVG